MSNYVLASLHTIVRGRVQGVFFRAFVQSHANALGLTGYVRNLQSGAVEVQAEGERGKLEELLQVLHQGPPAARVEKVEESWSDYNGDFSSFSVRS
ncbi:acylphosphatase [Chloroflexota bacterium]